MSSPKRWTNALKHTNIRIDLIRRRMDAYELDAHLIAEALAMLEHKFEMLLKAMQVSTAANEAAVKYHAPR